MNKRNTEMKELWEICRGDTNENVILISLYFFFNKIKVDFDKKELQAAHINASNRYFLNELSKNFEKGYEKIKKLD